MQLNKYKIFFVLLKMLPTFSNDRKEKGKMQEEMSKASFINKIQKQGWKGESAGVRYAGVERGECWGEVCRGGKGRVLG